MNPSQLYLQSLLQDLEDALGKQLDLTRLWSETSRPNAEEEKLLATAASSVADNKGLAGSQLEAMFPQLIQVTKYSGKPYLFPIRPLNLSSECFPTTSTSTPNLQWLPEFQKAVNAIPKDEAGRMADNLLFQIWRFGWCVPSGRGGVSLYDYARTKAGVAIALAASGDKVMLISGGVSGIQNYIYDITSRKASKNLKGRSFYVQLVNDAVIFKLLKDVGLHQANVVMNSGGKFLIVAPDTADFRSSLETLVQTISDQLYEAYGDGLNLEMVWSDDTLKPISPSSFYEAMKGLDEKANKERYKRLSRQIKGTDETLNYKDFFNPELIDGVEDKDDITNEILFKGEAVRKGGLVVKQITQDQIDIVQWLRDTSSIVFSDQPIEGIERFVQPLGTASGVYAYLKSNKQDYNVPNKATVIEYVINNPGPPPTQVGLVKGFVLYSGKDTPLNERRREIDGEVYPAGAPMTFEMLAEAPGSRFERLGLLRMDVDGLGKTFSKGFDKSLYPHISSSLAAFSALSRNFDFFFKGHLNKIWEDSPVYCQATQIIYAGGDDLFILGRWDAVIQLAKDIRTRFKQWVCDNPSISISGGVSIVTPKYPVIRAAKEAGRMEDRAKEHEYDGQEKNAITLFNTAMNWDSEYVEMEKMKRQLVESVDKDVLVRGTLQKIQTYYEQATFQKAKDKTESWRWRIAYDFARSADRGRFKEERKQLLQGITQGIFTKKISPSFKNDKLEYFDLLFVAAVWASYETRINQPE